MWKSHDRRFDEFADNHRRARSDSWATVGHASRVGLDDLDHVDVETKGFGGDLRKDSVCSLADLGAGGEYLHFTVGGGFSGDD